MFGLPIPNPFKLLKDSVGQNGVFTKLGLTGGGGPAPAPSNPFALPPGYTGFGGGVNPFPAVPTSPAWPTSPTGPRSLGEVVVEADRPGLFGLSTQELMVAGGLLALVGLFIAAQ